MDFARFLKLEESSKYCVRASLSRVHQKSKVMPPTSHLSQQHETWTIELLEVDNIKPNIQDQVKSQVKEPL